METHQRCKDQFFERFVVSETYEVFCIGTMESDPSEKRSKAYLANPVCERATLNSLKTYI